ncbi:MAG TPA: hypothetical protein PKW55_01460 [Spirochaetota bacterium]|nr:hypothetical protein [Spirochaetota bacterium]HOM38842.1 hypothetical protein [Spirochaetota bacterium]HPQ49137.1 hypothetical protein [Spirochaetota bacterium]
MNRKNSFIFLVVLFIFFNSVFAIDEFNNFNIKVKADLNNFKVDIIAEFNVKESVVDDLINNVKMEPADVYLTLKLKELTKKDTNVIVTEFNKNKEKGWGVIAKELGIKPGSKEFHELKAKIDLMKNGKSPFEKKKKDIKNIDKKKK